VHHVGGSDGGQPRLAGTGIECADAWSPAPGPRPLVPGPRPPIRYTQRMLLCSVRGCQLDLVRDAGRMVCPRKHSFDIARSGYINLLQPQERRAKQPGDTAEAIAARRRLHDRGFTNHHRLAIAEAIHATPGDVVLDAGCGDGFYLGTLQLETGFQAHGVDISIPAVDAAARRYPECEWIVANADRLIPYADRSFSIVWSITARMNPGEFRRVLREGGRLLVAIPAPDDLIELRGSGRDRVAQTVERFAGSFTLVNQRRVSACADLDASDVHDVLVSIYRPMGQRPAEAMRVTFSLDLLLFQPA
jgi:23S rRNA (guanine745-N1)-methyltransferase